MTMDEVEIKFYVEDPETLRRALREAGATGGGRVFERNTRHDDAAGSLRARGELLRLRRDTACRLTHKSLPLTADPEFKVHRETETVVEDCGAMEAILRALGFPPVQVYEKYRETYSMGKAHVLLDTMPYGVFVEIEGGREEIRDIARRLGLPMSRRITATYLAIHDKVRDRLGLAAPDLTFEAYRGQERAAETVLGEIEAGA
jgi:adenylate cyclase class 2